MRKSQEQLNIVSYNLEEPNKGSSHSCKCSRNVKWCSTGNRFRCWCRCPNLCCSNTRKNQKDHHRECESIGKLRTLHNFRKNVWERGECIYSCWSLVEVVQHSDGFYRGCVELQDTSEQLCCMFFIHVMIVIDTYMWNQFEGGLLVYPLLHYQLAQLCIGTFCVLSRSVMVCLVFLKSFGMWCSQCWYKMCFVCSTISMCVCVKKQSVYRCEHFNALSLP